MAHKPKKQSTGSFAGHRDRHQVSKAHGTYAKTGYGKAPTSSGYVKKKYK